jgi:UDP-GlcNAc3NAcA epimerase
MIQGIEDILLKEKPDVIILYGDTNSTLAGAITAAKLRIPVAHIEAGLRSFNKSMPEEINRIVCDHISTFLFSPTLTGVLNLEKEGIRAKNKPSFTMDSPGVFHCGDVMYDNAVYFADKVEQVSSIFKDLNLEKNNYLLVTIHRDNNTDDPQRLNAIFRSISRICEGSKLKVIIPLHPRTTKIMESTLEKPLYYSITNNPLIKIISPVSFFDMIALEKNSCMILTDSGGVQKEAFFYEKPCIILRPETEWVEIVEAGAAIVCDADEEKIMNAFHHFKTKNLNKLPSIFGDGNAAYFICNTITNNFKKPCRCC